ncbi:hypothetical protein [Leucobacter sp. M11]|uniref:hypothetical protein n=1 Tax=Leucobacter sp. M11 TaxID=2993565 RepID=UPI002D7FBEB7|nr:hypothetical protein [Leucobacter sp. M11]MEB4614076.1 hypothetical protein [Leucobacter sp. M11]
MRANRLRGPQPALPVAIARAVRQVPGALLLALAVLLCLTGVLSNAGAHAAEGGPAALAHTTAAPSVQPGHSAGESAADAPDGAHDSPGAPGHAPEPAVPECPTADTSCQSPQIQLPGAEVPVPGASLVTEAVAAPSCSVSPSTGVRPQTPTPIELSISRT